MKVSKNVDDFCWVPAALEKLMDFLEMLINFGMKFHVSLFFLVFFFAIWKLMKCSKTWGMCWVPAALEKFMDFFEKIISSRWGDFLSNGAAPVSVHAFCLDLNPRGSECDFLTLEIVSQSLSMPAGGILAPGRWECDFLAREAISYRTVQHPSLCMPFGRILARLCAYLFVGFRPQGLGVRFPDSWGDFLSNGAPPITVLAFWLAFWL